VSQCIGYEGERALICAATLAFVQTERVSGSPPRFLLKK
jgi:hypothetical protein